MASFAVEEKPFRLRPRANKHAGRDEVSVWSRAGRSVMRMVRHNSRKPKASSGKGAKKTAALANRTSRARNQRVAVRVTYAQNLTTLAEWQGAKDPRLFKLIISPEFGERMDLVAYTKVLMEGMGQDLGKQLDWVAVVHQNTDHPHVHVALRGISKDGQEIKLPREYIQKGIRLRAEDLATAQLGIRTEADIAEAHRREVVQRRFTPLDRAIAKQQPSNAKGQDFPALANPANPTLKPYQRQEEQFIANRLRALATMGLATEKAPGQWEVRGNFAEVLRTMQRTSDAPGR